MIAKIKVMPRKLNHPLRYILAWWEADTYDPQTPEAAERAKWYIQLGENKQNKNIK